MFVDFSSLKSGDPNSNGVKLENQGSEQSKIQNYISEVVSDTSLLKRVCSSKFKVLRSAQVIKEYFQVCFDSQYYWIFHWTVHSTLVGYHFKTKSAVSSKNVKNAADYKNVGEYFFKDKHGDIWQEVEMSRVDMIYNDYINVMNQIYKRLAGHFKRIIWECFSEEQKDELGSFVDTEPLKHPGDNDRYA